jgi:hypothetical protein
MQRHRFGEIEDKLWLPSIFRNIMTDILGMIVAKFRIYDPTIPLIKEAMKRANTTRIIDLCSGSSEAWIQILAQLREHDESVSVTLTDKYPNIEALEKIKEDSNGEIHYSAKAIDATDVPAELTGMRTIFSAFHHFEPDSARKILQDAVNSRSAIGVFEFTEKRAVQIPLVLLLPLFVFLFTLFNGPRNFKMLLWTIIIPIIPLIFTYDGFISSMQTYSPKDLRELVKGVNSEAYEWEIGQIPSTLRSVKITYLLGFPKDLNA